jgi:hypothetical protein
VSARRLGLVAFVTALVTTAVADAQPKPAPAPATEPPKARAGDDDGEIRALLREADAAFAAHQYAAAEAAYEKAFAMKPGFDIASNLADCEREQGKHSEAAAHYSYALRTFPASFDPEIKRSLKQAFDEVQAKVATVRVIVSAAGAVVRVDGQDAGQSPLPDPIFLDPGSHLLEATLGDTRADRTLDVTAGARLEIALDLTSAGTTPPGFDHPMPALLITGGILAAAGIGVGIGLAIASSGKASAAEDALAPFLSGKRCSEDPAACDVIDAALGARDDLATGSLAAFVAGGTFAVVTLGYALISLASAPSSGASGSAAMFQPTLFVGPTTAGFLVTHPF